jgi:hypothetical protein
VIHGVEHHIVRVLIELAHLLAMYVLLPRHPEDVHQPRLAHLPVYQLRGEGEVVQDIGQGTRCPGVPALRLDDEAAQGDHVSIHACLQ